MGRPTTRWLAPLATAEVGVAILFKGMYGVHTTAGFVIWRAVEYLLPVLIAAPCMGMRSASSESIYRRAVRWRANFGRILRHDRSGLERPQGIAYKPKRTREEDESSE